MRMRESDGNVVFLERDYIGGASSSFGAKLHRHPLLELYAACDGSSHVALESGVLEGGMIAIGPGAVHAIADSGKRGIALFIDPLSDFGYTLTKNALRDQRVRVLEAPPSPDGDIRQAAARMIGLVSGEAHTRPFDDAVLQAVELLNKDDCPFDMGALASGVYLSKSRLAHLFSAQTGITLKDYIQYKRLERACRRMLRGASITDAAFDTGFAGSSHIASSSMKLTGLQLRRLLGL